jgi:hypothetical protein
MSAAIAQLEHDDQAGDREFRWLLPFLHPAEIDATLTQNPIRLRDRRPTDQVLAELRQHRVSLEPYVMESVQALPPSLVNAAHEVQAREVYRREYASKCDVSIGLAPLFALLAPQPLADMDYVAELGGSLSPEPDELDDFAFSFPQGSIPEPAVIGNTVMFSTPAPSVYVSPVPTYRPVAGGYEVIARVEPRPNYVFVAQVQGLGGRLMLINGVHHVLALLRAGRRYAPAILRQSMTVEELGLPQTSLLAQAGTPRPPLVRDFLSDCAVQVLKRRTGIATQVMLQTNQVMFPTDGFGG